MRDERWTLAHAFIADMGGFKVKVRQNQKPEERMRLNSEDVYNFTFLILQAFQLLLIHHLYSSLFGRKCNLRALIRNDV